MHSKPWEFRDRLAREIDQLNGRVSQLYQQGRVSEALALAKQSVEMSRQHYGMNRPECAASLHNLAVLLQTQGDYAQAAPLYRQALEIYRRVLGEDHPSVAQILNDLAGVLLSLGNSAGAEPLFRQALEIRRRVLGESHPDYATSLNNLAGLLQTQGNFAGAALLFRRALEVYRRAGMENHPSYATSLNNLAALSFFQGDYAGAEPLYRQALEIRRRVLGERHPDYAISLNNLAGLLHAKGSFAEATHLCRQANAKDRQAWGEYHPNFAQSLNNLAELLRVQGDFGGAEPLYRQAVEIRHRLFGEDHPHVAESLNHLACLLYDQGDYARAEPVYRQALAIRSRTLGENHPDFAQSLSNLALVLLAKSPPQEREALSLLQQAAAAHDQRIGQLFSYGSDQQRLAFLQTLRTHHDLLLSLVLAHFAQDHAVIRAALDFLLRRKLLGAEGSAVLQQAIRGGRYPHLRPMLDQLSKLHTQIIQKTLEGSGADDRETHERRLAEWTAESQRLEADLARQIPEMNLDAKLRASDRRAVALALPEETALVEFVRFQVFDFQAVGKRSDRGWQPARYLAFVLHAGAADEVLMLGLGPADPLDTLIEEFRATVDDFPDHRRDAKRQRRPTVPTVDGPGVALRREVFDALVPALHGRTTLLLSPDGALARLPFEVLPMDDGRRLVDAYQLSYVACGRDVLRFGQPFYRSPGPALIVADPAYQLGSSPGSQAANTVSGQRSADLKAGTIEFGPLAHTRAEGKEIATLLGVAPLLDKAALESRFKAAFAISREAVRSAAPISAPQRRIRSASVRRQGNTWIDTRTTTAPVHNSVARSPRFVHLATHGFFLTEQDYHDEMVGRLGSAAVRGKVMENPMLRSGLALAGAQDWLDGRPLPLEAEDGLLTAADVTGLDLLDTEVVVLSACESGVGEVRTGEGVFGLRRAFVVAGARTLLSSLWRVPDEQTRQLMTAFYRRILAGEARGAALRAAQEEIRRAHPDPFYWGAFILQGESGPLTKLTDLKEV